MDFATAISLFERFPKFNNGIVDLWASNIEHTKKLLLQLGYDVDSATYASVIHVAGTKGKGSTCVMVSSLLKKYAKRKKIGLFTSPHLRDICERIKVNDIPIEKHDFARIFEQIIRHDNGQLFQFKILTAIALLYFYYARADFIVLETGIGGIYDTTNIFRRTASTIITSIGWDHTELLGDSLAAIAFNKAGIIKRDVPLFIPSDLPLEAFNVIKETAIKREAPVHICTQLDYGEYIPLGQPPSLL